MPKRISTTAIAFAISIAATICLIAAVASLKWRYVHDSPLMIYAGFLLAGGKVPYRDFFDMNMPGTYFVMALMGRVLGWNDLGFRVFDLLCLAAICVSTLLWLRRFGRLPALAATIAFPLWYLSQGPELSMQREYIALVPFSALLTAATTHNRFNPGLRTLLAGFLAGVTFLIKPHFLLLCLPPFIMLVQPDATSISVRRRIVAFVGGMCLPLGAMFIYLLRTGGLEPFIEIAVDYWPLYARMTGSHEPISGLRRDLYIVISTLFGLMTIYGPMAVLGLIVLYADHTQRRYARMVTGVLVAALVYPALSGQFWSYHWLPFCYVALCAASLALRVVPIKRWSVAGIAPIVCVILLLFSLSWECLDNTRSRKWEGVPKGGVPDEISQFLLSHMESADTVQPLDWTGGAVHGMLMARAPLATRFMYDFHFYHHLSSPYIGMLRREFMDELSSKNPRFIIQVLENKPWPTGADTTRQFPELQAFLEHNYATARQGTTYRILERNGPAQEQGGGDASKPRASP